MFVDMVPVTDVFTTNSYFYIDETTRHGFLIDPGAEPQRLKQIIKDRILTLFIPDYYNIIVNLTINQQTLT